MTIQYSLSDRNDGSQSFKTFCYPICNLEFENIDERNEVLDNPTTWLSGLLGKATSAEEFVLGIGEWDKTAYAMEAFHETYDFYMTPTTAFPPAMTVPLYQTANGLSVGVQIMAAKGREDLLFQLAGVLEGTEHWLDVRQNPLFGGET